MTNAALYALCWLSFGLLHSLLARTKAKSLLSNILAHRYRVVYNAVATIHIGAVFAAGLFLYRDAAPFEFPGWLLILAYLMMLSGLLIVIASLTQYDTGLFSGLTQWQNKTPITAEPYNAEPLNISGINSHVRHPLYLGLFLILWGNATSTFGLMTAVWGSLYLLAGSRFEERDLVRVHGHPYILYQQQVPAYVPWKLLSKSRKAQR